MAKATILFDESEIKYYKEQIPIKMRLCLSALAKGYGIDETLLYFVFVLGCEYSKYNLYHITD